LSSIFSSSITGFKIYCDCCTYSLSRLETRLRVYEWWLVDCLARLLLLTKWYLAVAVVVVADCSLGSQWLQICPSSYKLFDLSRQSENLALLFKAHSSRNTADESYLSEIMLPSSFSNLIMLPFFQRQPAALDFSVTIVAAGPIRGGGGLVHAVAVKQPVQSWTVLRSHDDFLAVAHALGDILSDLPQCPQNNCAGSDINSIAASRNELQEWLSSVLLYPRARESPAVRNFLTFGANMTPPQFEGVDWVAFTPSSPSPRQAASSTPKHQHYQPNLDDMDMDDMFVDGEEDGEEGSDIEGEYEDIVPASVRYNATDEQFTEEEEMEIMAMAGEVELVEDIGSLAQSMGASHLGRSLQLQAEISVRSQAPAQGSRSSNPSQQGVTLGSAARGFQTGGLGTAMEEARTTTVDGLGDSFYQKRPVSAPRLDSFKMIKVIGKGSFGKVFLVKEHQTGEMFALKVLRKDNIIKRNQVEHTKTERSVLGYCKHPFIVSMNMAFQSKDKLYFVLDYCAGGELFFHLGKLGKFPEPRARFYAAEIILAISYVHSLDIIYRDLKPENVLLDARGHVRLTDFGLSKEGISKSSSGANSFCGTPEYLAPEILNRQGHGRAVDWWSLGALLYEMLTGLPPFYCQDRERLFEKIRNSDLHYPASLSRPAKQLLLGLLTRDPNVRLGSGPNDARDIQAHEFFSDIDWDKLSTGSISPPWKPTINGSLDTSQFDREFTSMPVFSPQSLSRNGFGATPRGDNPFEGFTFTDRQLHGPGAETAGN
jgi:serine/threonine protein kinase